MNIGYERNAKKRASEMVAKHGVPVYSELSPNEQVQQAGCKHDSWPTIVGPDQECWVKARVRTAMRAALLINKSASVRADEDIVLCALEGVANGAAVEIIRTLGMEPGFVNLRRPPGRSSRRMVG
jgi:hypothetical protein